MPQKAMVWEVTDAGALTEIPESRLNLESRLEDWLAGDISILDDALLVIGRQVTTDFGGVIDLLCIDPNADLVILELKRDKTPREIVAQTLDYASWVHQLSHERLSEIGQKYLVNRNLEEAFLHRFGSPLPDTINSDHRMVVVAAEIDPSSERIIEYLSHRHGVSINAATFQYFKDSSGRELLTRVFLLEPDDVDYKARTRGGSKRKPNLTFEQLEGIAKEEGVGAFYVEAVELLLPLFDKTRTTQSNISFVSRLDGSKNAILNLIPRDSSNEDGLAFQVYSNRISKRFGIAQEALAAALPPGTTEWAYYPDAPEDWRGFAGYFKSVEDTRRLAALLREKPSE